MIPIQADFLKKGSLARRIIAHLLRSCAQLGMRVLMMVALKMPSRQGHANEMTEIYKNPSDLE